MKKELLEKTLEGCKEKLMNAGGVIVLTPNAWVLDNLMTHAERNGVNTRFTRFVHGTGALAELYGFNPLEGGSLGGVVNGILAGMSREEGLRERRRKKGMLISLIIQSYANAVKEGALHSSDLLRRMGEQLRIFKETENLDGVSRHLIKELSRYHPEVSGREIMRMKEDLDKLAEKWEWCLPVGKVKKEITMRNLLTEKGLTAVEMPENEEDICCGRMFAWILRAETHSSKEVGYSVWSHDCRLTKGFWQERNQMERKGRVMCHES